MAIVSLIISIHPKFTINQHESREAGGLVNTFIFLTLPNLELYRLVSLAYH